VLKERLPDTLRGVRPELMPNAPELGPGFSLDEHLLGIERAFLHSALSRAAGDRAAAADLLGVTPRSLRYLISKHGIPPG
jgi:transcriptional regulator with GAF, ATPase, and Fis domain